MSSLSMPGARPHNTEESSSPAGVDCPKCHTHLPNLAEYCLHCGAHVVPAPMQHTRGEQNHWRVGALVCMVIGVACLLGALLTSAFFGQQTVLDWQAVQLWRIEWLLAGIALFALARFLQSESRK